MYFFINVGDKSLCKDAFTLLYDMYQCPVVCHVSLYHLSLMAIYMSVKMNGTVMILPYDIRQAIREADNLIYSPCKEFTEFFYALYNPGTQKYQKFQFLRQFLRSRKPLI